jgi:hypothetical protein
MPDAHADALMEVLKLNIVADRVSTVLGRKATNFNEWARRNAAALR